MAQTLYVHAMRAASREGLFFAYAKTKAQISCKVTAQLSGAFFPVFIASIIPLLPGSEMLYKCLSRHVPGLVVRPKGGFSRTAAHMYFDGTATMPESTNHCLFVCLFVCSLCPNYLFVSF